MVDNGSVDDSVAWLREHHPHIRLIDWATNAGFAAAVNAGIRAGSHPLVFLLNNDTELAADCLELLVRAAERGQEYALFAPKMLSYHQRDRLDGAGEGYLRGGAGYRLGAPSNCNAFIFWFMVQCLCREFNRRFGVIAFSV